MTLEEEKQIIAKIQSGDIKRVAEITGLSAKYCQKITRRPTAKLYPMVIEILTKVIEVRENMVSNLKQPPTDL